MWIVSFIIPKWFTTNKHFSVKLLSFIPLCAGDPSFHNNSFCFHIRLSYQELIGGVQVFTKDHYIEINGYSNMFWGWGGEDDNLYTRIKAKGTHPFQLYMIWVVKPMGSELNFDFEIQLVMFPRFFHTVEVHAFIHSHSYIHTCIATYA